MAQPGVFCQTLVPLAHGVAVNNVIYKFPEQSCSQAQQSVEMGLNGCAESSWNLTTERLDSAYGWLPWPDTLPTGPLGLLADPCQTPPGANLPGANLEGELALALLPDDWHTLGSCSLAEVVRLAQVCWQKYVHTEWRTTCQLYMLSHGLIATVRIGGPAWRPKPPAFMFAKSCCRVQSPAISQVMQHSD